MPAKVKPVHQVRLGNIKAAIWRNETESGAQFNVTFERLFKKGDEWQSSLSFGKGDLLQLGKVASEAHSWIFAQAAKA
jgi:hypothetical protein